MFKLSVALLLCSTIALNALSQQKGVIYYDLLKKHPKETFFKNSAGRLHGPYNAFFEDGTKSIEANYEDGALEGKYIEYSTNGIAVVGNYKQGRKDGIQKSYRDPEGVVYKYVIEEEMYKDDNIVWKKRYTQEDGKVYKYLEETYDDGRVVVTKGYKANGEQWFQQSINGLNYKLRGLITFPHNLKSITNQIENRLEYTTVNNLIDGLYREWDKDGRLRIECEFKEGKGNGVYKQYHGNGVLAVEKSYKDAKDDGRERTYDSSGSLMSEGDYNNGLFTGYWKEISGDTLITFRYVSGEIVSREALNRATYKVSSIDNIDRLSVGKRFLLARDYEAADSIFKAAVHSSIDKPPYEICVNVAKIYADNKDHFQAVKWYDSAIVKYGVFYDRLGRLDKNFIKCEDYIEWIKCALNYDDYNRTIQILNRYTSRSDNDALGCNSNGADILYARTFAKMNDTANAKKYYEVVYSRNDPNRSHFDKPNQSEYVESCKFLLTLADQQRREFDVKRYAVAMLKSLPQDIQAKALIDKYFPKQKDGSRKGISPFDEPIE